MTKFATAMLAIILLLAATVLETSHASIPTVRGAITSHAADAKSSVAEDDNEKTWSITQVGTTHTHRHLEPDNSDCLLLMRDTQFEDRLYREGQSHVWVCEFPFAVSQSKLHGRTFIDIDVTEEENGLTKATIDATGAISGASILKTTGAYIEETLDTGEMIMHIPTTGTMEVISIDSEHHDSSHSRRRRLASPNPGTLTVLVIKVIDSGGAQLSASNAQLVNDIFEDDYSLKTGYASCSKDQLIMEPASNRDDGDVGVVNGITSVVIDIEAQEGEEGNDSQLREKAEAKATEEYGNLENQYDLVMMCLPRTGNYVAYAYINGWLSVYNDDWCQQVSAQMHEIGHNLGFGHSNKNGVGYADRTGMMGYSYKQDDGPKMCFNAPKNFQTGWYTNAQASFYPLASIDTMVEWTLIGIDDYQVSGNNNGHVVTLRLGDMGDESNSGGDDYYVGFNLQSGINEGSIGGTNQVLVFRKTSGGPSQYGESDRVADLNPGQAYNILGFKGTSLDVTIRVKALENNNRQAPIEITTSEGVPVTLPPTSTPDPAFENLGKGYCRDSTGQYNDNWDANFYCDDLPNCQARCKNQDQCVGVAWAYAPLDNNNGCNSLSLPRCVMYYSLAAPGVVVEQASGIPAEYTTYRYLPFIPQSPGPVPNPQTPAPVPITSAPISPTASPVVPITAEPTQPPSRSPTEVPTTQEPTPEPTVFDKVDEDSATPTESPTKSCANRQGYLWKNKDRKNCQWAGKGSTFIKKQKKCKKRDSINGNNVAFHCRTTCAKVGVGPCKKRD